MTVNNPVTGRIKPPRVDPTIEIEIDVDASSEGTPVGAADR
ncbi:MULTISPECIES: hypothetical protein [unclassified Curtobacterium]|nr:MULTISPECIES: hypothetical protein [unclassified Curtobacterium]